MMRWIVGSSLKFRLLVLAVAAGLLALGIVRLSDAPVEALPDFGPTRVEVQTEALGLSAEEVENLITNPMEQEFFNGMPWLASIRSDSLPGLSRMDMSFEPGTDPIKARQVVQERLTMVRALPTVSKSPTVIQPTSTTSRLMMIGLSSKDVSLIDMSVLARFNIRQRLIAVPGVANVSVWGLRDRQLQVLVDPDKLRQNNVPLDAVVTSAGNAMWSSPLTFVEASTPGTGGFIDNANQRIEIQHKQPVKTAADLAQVAVDGAGKKGLRLGDIATVVEDHQLLIGDGLANDEQSLLMVVERFPGTSVSQVTKNVETALDQMRPGLTGITVDTSLYRPASYLDTVRDNLGRSLLIGLVLLALAFGVMLVSWRAALVGLVSVSLSLAVATLVLSWFGLILNAMVVAGLVMAVAIVVDDATIDVLHIRRRLGRAATPAAATATPATATPAAATPAAATPAAAAAAPAAESRGGQPADGRSTAPVGDPTGASGQPDSRVASTLGAVLEMRGGVFVATVIAVLSVVPVLALGNVTGSFLRPLALGYVVAVLASMLVALTVTPALSLLLGGRSAPRESPVARTLGRAHAAALSRLVGRPLYAAVAVGVLVLAGLAVLPALRNQSVAPPLQDRDLLVTWQGPAGTSLPEMSRLTAQASRELRAVPGVRSVGAHVGRASLSDQIVGADAAEMWVSIDADTDYGAATKAVRDVIEGFPGLRSEVTTYPDERLRAAQTGSDSALVVRLYGRDYDVLQAKAEEVAGIVAGVDGVGEPRLSVPDYEPTVEVEVDIPKAAAAGLKPGDARRAAATIASGITAGHMYEGQKIYEVKVWGTPENRHSLSSLQNLRIDSPKGGQVRLGDIASVRIAPNPTNIKHDAVARYVDVTADVRGRGLGAVTRDVENAVRNVTFPTEHHVEVLSESAQRQSTRQRTLAYGIAFLVALFFLLQATFGSWRLASLLFLTLPVALAGGALVAALRKDVMSVAALMGLVVVLAVAVRGGIVLIKHYQRLEREGERPGRDLVLRGTQERFGPVLTAALATVAALAPLLVLGATSGLEVVQPLVAIILGGLVTATLLNLFVLPTLYLRFAARPQPASAGPHHVEMEQTNAR
jgi:Cu/Ag efflux pump CusA